MLGLALTACHTTTSNTASTQSAAAVSPAGLGDGTLIFDFSKARVTEIENEEVLSSNRAVNPDEYGPGNRRTVTTLRIDGDNLLLSKYTKTGPQTAHIKTITSSAEVAPIVKNKILPSLNQLTEDQIVQLLEYRVADGSEEYKITFTSPTTGTAVVEEAGGTFIHTIKNVQVTYVPSASAAPAPAAASQAAISAPASLEGSWIRMDYSVAGIGGRMHVWYYMHKGALYRLNREHPADKVPAKPTRLRQVAVHHEDETGRPYSPTERLIYRPMGNRFELSFDIATIRRLFNVTGAMKRENGMNLYLPQPIVVTLDKADAKSVSGSCMGYEGDDTGCFEPKIISRVTIFR